eukprot:6206027-Pleurochrysis_carterae.AAC.5
MRVPTAPMTDRGTRRARWRARAAGDDSRRASVAMGRGLRASVRVKTGGAGTRRRRPPRNEVRAYEHRSEEPGQKSRRRRDRDGERVEKVAGYVQLRAGAAKSTHARRVGVRIDAARGEVGATGLVGEGGHREEGREAKGRAAP